MTPKLDNKVVSSFLLWLDNTILTKGEAYTNWSGQFYRVGNTLNGYYTYALPFKQINADQSIAGANIMSGVYLNNDFITVGQSGLAGINYNQGQVYFSQNVDSYTISGQYSIKDFNLSLTSDPEEKLLFETKYNTKPKMVAQVTGLAPNTLTYPVIFVKNEGSENNPFAFGGEDTTKFYIRTIIIADSQFLLDAVNSILRDKVRTFVPLLQGAEMPFNSFGDANNGGYNYQTLTEGKPGQVFISKVSNSRLSARSVVMNQIRDLNPGVFAGITDFELEMIRLPRLE